MPRELDFDGAPKPKPYTPLQFETDERPCSATPPSPPPPSLRFKFVSIDSSGSAVVTPMSAAEAPSPPPRSPPRSPGKSPLPVIQVQLAPLELVSFGYDRGNAPSGCARTINCGHLAKACATCAASASTSGAASSSSSAAAAWTSTPYIEELCSFLVCELQALVVSRSPSSAMSDRCFSPPLSPRLVASSPSSPGSPSTPSPHAGPAAPASLPPLPPPLLPAPPPRAADRGSLLVPVGAPVLDLTAFAAAAARAPSPPPTTLLHLSTSPLRLPADARASALVRRAPSPPAEWALDAAPAPGRGGAAVAAARVTLSCDGRRVRATVRAIAPAQPAASSAAPACASAAVRTPPRVGRSGGRGRVRVGIGCKDGESLSVMVVDHLAKQLERRGIAVTVKHRELQRARRRAQSS